MGIKAKAKQITKNTVGTEEIKTLHNFNKSFLKKPKKGKARKFEDIVLELGWSKADLIERERQYKIESRIMYSAAFALFSYIMLTMGSDTGSIFIGQMMMIFILVLSGFTKSFRAWQVEKREFKPIGSFICDPEGWIR